MQDDIKPPSNPEQPSGDTMPAEPDKQPATVSEVKNSPPQAIVEAPTEQASSPSPQPIPEIKSAKESHKNNDRDSHIVPIILALIILALLAAIAIMANAGL
ncbi:MAG TPA: hypothetical protein VFX86_04650 [Candidatus Saccharimonadales bacterium]|nr:hypothetical protein [Candidatus Saccharimonadales bacterium]